MTRVAGLDGTSPEGWVAVCLEDDHLVSIQLCDHLEEALAASEEAEVVAVNLAIGHDDPDGQHRGGKRLVDLEARQRWGEDRPDLPLVPPPWLLDHGSRQAASLAAQAEGVVEPERGLWRLKDRLVALDARADDERLFEVRTEASFQAMQDKQGREGRLPTPPYSWKGMVARLKLLAEEGLRPARSTGGVGKLSPKDAVGASAAAWTAQRIARDQAESLLDQPPEDPRTGRPVTIWF